MAGIMITTQNDLPGPDGDELYVLFVNQTDYGNARFPHCQESCPLGLTRPPGGPTHDHATAL
jgi:hypothetical protein